MGCTTGDDGEHLDWRGPAQGRLKGLGQRAGEVDLSLTLGAWVTGTAAHKVVKVAR